MSEHMQRSIDFWQNCDFRQDLDRSVTAKVEYALHHHQEPREPLIVHLREIEVRARRACSCRQTIQILVSGRRLLGDRMTVGTSDGPFAHTLGIGA